MLDEGEFYWVYDQLNGNFIVLLPGEESRNLAALFEMNFFWKFPLIARKTRCDLSVRRQFCNLDIKHWISC